MLLSVRRVKCFLLGPAIDGEWVVRGAISWLLERLLLMFVLVYSRVKWRTR